LPQDTTVPSLVTVALTVSEKNVKVAFFTFDLDAMTLTFGQGHRPNIFSSDLPQGTTVPSLVTVALIVSEKNGKVAFFTL